MPAKAAQKQWILHRQFPAIPESFPAHGVEQSKHMYPLWDYQSLIFQMRVSFFCSVFLFLNFKSVHVHILCREKMCDHHRETTISTSPSMLLTGSLPVQNAEPRRRMFELVCERLNVGIPLGANELGYLKINTTHLSSRGIPRFSLSQTTSKITVFKVDTRNEILSIFYFLFCLQNSKKKLFDLIIFLTNVFWGH